MEENKQGDDHDESLHLGTLLGIKVLGNKVSLSDRKGTMNVSVWSKKYIYENMRVFLQHFNSILNQLINWFFSSRFRQGSKLLWQKINTMTSAMFQIGSTEFSNDVFRAKSQWLKLWIILWNSIKSQRFLFYSNKLILTWNQNYHEIILLQLKYQKIANHKGCSNIMGQVFLSILQTSHAKIHRKGFFLNTAIQ